MTERRLSGVLKSASVPEDYTRLVQDILLQNFLPAINYVKKKQKSSTPTFSARGRLYPDEIVLSLSFQVGKSSPLATTVHVSVDYDPTASAPKAEDLLALCLDVGGGVFNQYLSIETPKILDAFVWESLSTLADLADVPFEWTKVDAQKRAFYVKLDKAHLDLEEMADKWLDEHDPDRQEREAEEAREAEELLAERTGRGRKH